MHIMQLRLRWRIHCGVEVTEPSTNKQHTHTHTLSSMGFEGQSCSKWWELQDSDQRPIQMREGANSAKKPVELLCCRKMPFQMIAMA